MAFKIKPVLLITFTAAVTLFTAWWLAERTDSDMRNTLLLETEIGARGINIEQVKNLTGTAADVSTPNYLKLKGQFATILNVNKKLRNVYLLGINNNGSLFFYACDRPLGHPEEAPAGTIYDDAPEGFYRAIKTGIASIEGSYTDKWGTFISGCVPLLDPETGKTIAIFAIDFNAKAWYWEIASRIALPVGLMLLAVVCVMVIFILVNRGKLLLESESRFEKLFGSPNAIMLLIEPESGSIVDANSAAAVFYGYSRERLRSMNIDEINNLPPKQVKEKRKNILAGNNEILIFPHRLANGEIRIVEVHSTPIDFKGKIILFSIIHDITDRKTVEKKLSESEKKYRNIFENAQEGIFQTNIDGSYRSANNKLAEMYGFESPEELINSRKDISKEAYSDANERDNFLKLMYEQGFVKGYEYEVKRKDGSKIWFYEDAKAIKDENGKIQYFEGFVVDITERKKAEEALRLSEAKHSSMISNISDVIGIMGADGLMKYKSPNIEKWFGWQPQDLIGTDGWLNVHPNDRERIQKEFYNLVQIENLATTVEYQYQCKDGSYKPIELTATNLLNNPIINGVLLNYHDISERRLKQDELNESNFLLGRAEKVAKTGTWKLMLNTKEFTGSLGAKIIYGIDNDKMVLEHVQKVPLPEYRQMLDNAMDDLIKKQIPYNYEFKICRVNDKKIIDIHSMAEYDKENNIVYGVIQDITEQKELEESLRNYASIVESNNKELDLALTNEKEATAKANEMALQAEMANKSKSIFLANMSHEIRTPLNAIIGFSQLINRDMALSETQKEYNVSIIRAGEHLLMLINDILELSKVEAGRMVLNPTTINLQTLINDMEMLFKERAQLKHLQLLFESSSNLSVNVRVDESKLRQIFINLLGNAIKFTDKGSVTVRTRIHKTTKDKSHLVVEIEDSGSGISENERNRLFKHFVQTSSGIKKGIGTGLGLALSRELAILMGGDITVSSKVEKGSVFTFTIEINEGTSKDFEAHSTIRVMSIDKTNNEANESYRILVVDDKEENLRVVVNLLQIVGFETNEAINGEDAIVKFKEWNPHLILMDMRMPVMDGYEATQRIKSTKKGKQTPVVALTASTFEEERKKTTQLDLQGYIRKPFHENELFATIGQILGVKYIYEDKAILEHENYLNNNEAFVEGLAKLPSTLILQMKDALSVADLDLLIELIKSITPDNTDIAQYLMELAKNYDYIHLQQILNLKETKQ